MKIWLFRRFYEEYPVLTGPEILYAPRKESAKQAQQQDSPRTAWRILLRYSTRAACGIECRDNFRRIASENNGG
jgi:hypothetical protein